jgi:hypothetical protein
MPKLNLTELGGSHPFTNFNSGDYWSGTSYSGTLSTGYWFYAFSGDNQNCCSTTAMKSVIAVRDCPGCTIVPEPISSNPVYSRWSNIGIQALQKEKKNLM